MKRALLGLALAACTAAESQPRSSPEPVEAPVSTLALVRSMAALAGVAADAAKLEARAKAIDANELTMRAFIDELVRDPRFGSVVVPSLVFGSYVNIRNYYALPATFVLQRDGDGPYFLRERCDAQHAVRVKPWWDLARAVEVCPDAYRPEKWTLAENEHGFRSKQAMSCDSQIGSPESENASLCGCGPNLVRCVESQDQYEDFAASLMAEMRDTTAYIVEHDLAMTALFTGKHTFRDRNTETYYRRQQAGTLETKRFDKLLADIDAWPAAGKWAPRTEVVPGQHAGLLTSPQLLHWMPDRRQRQRAYYEVLWCTLRNTFGATTQKVLEINAAGNNFFVHESWSRLAHTPLCTNCHARLDYGFQFFSGYPDSRASVHFMPSEHKRGKQGPLYGRDIDDRRGDAVLTPQGFAELATRQPEFAGCMTDHFASYVLGERATLDDKRAIGAAIADTGTFRAAMTVALERYAERARTRPATPPVPSHGSAAMDPALRGMIDRYCIDCHDAETSRDEARGDFTQPTLARKTLVDMTDKIAFGIMPKEHELETREREQFVRLLADHLWSDPASRTEAERYFLGRGRGLPAQQLDNVLFEIGRIARAPSGITWGALERGLWTDQDTVTPGLIGVGALEALRACRARTDEPLEACLTRATSPRTLSRWPVDP